MCMLQIFKDGLHVKPEQDLARHACMRSQSPAESNATSLMIGVAGHRGRACAPIQGKVLQAMLAL